MSGYTLGDSPSVFLARFEGSTGTQTWLSHLGEDTGMPHRAQSVAVVEDSQYGFSLAGGGGAESTVPEPDAGGGAPAVDGEEAGGSGSTGNDARIVVVGYNTSAASADSHSNTGFTAAADTSGNWAWFSASEKADRQTAIAIGGAGQRRQQRRQQQQGGGGGRGSDESFAYIVGTVAASEASPGNYLFLDIQRVVREGSDATPAPADGLDGRAESPEAAADPAGGASSTTGLSQGSSLWLLIIAPIFVVLSCIMMVGYVSKQCAIAFGTRPPHQHEMDSMEFGAGAGRGARKARSYRRSKRSASDWNDDASASPGSASGDRRRRRGGGGGGGDGGGGGRGGRSATWRSAFRNRDGDGPPYHELGTRKEGHDARGGDGQGRGESRGSSAATSPDGEVELMQVTARHRTPYDSPRGEGSPGNGGGGGRPARGAGGSRESLPGFEDFSPGGTSRAAASGWDAFEGEEGNLAGAGERESGLSHLTGNPRDDEPTEGVLLNSN